MRRNQSMYGCAPIYGGIRETEIAVRQRETEIGQEIMGGTVIGKYPCFVLIQRRNMREAILWKDLILGTYQAKELRG